MLTCLILAALTIGPPPSDGLPPPKAVKLAARADGPCLCHEGASVCRCGTRCPCVAKSAAARQKPPQVAASRKAVYRTENRKVCTGGRCYFTSVQVFDHWEQQPDASNAPLATDAAAHTPLAEVNRVLELLPKPAVGFVDFGCGYDARWCVAAAEKWGCRVTGVEIDPDRATAARERVRNLGLDRLITIIDGDALTTDVQGDVAVVYLYPDVLAKLKPRLEKFTVVASYRHAVPGLPMQQNGDSFIYRRTAFTAAPTQTSTQRYAVWNGQIYTSDYNPRCNCPMCRSIRYQLAGH